MGYHLPAPTEIRRRPPAVARRSIKAAWQSTHADSPATAIATPAMIPKRKSNRCGQSILFFPNIESVNDLPGHGFSK